MNLIARFLKALLNKDPDANKYPHEIFPEILEWEAGDELISPNSLGASFYYYIGVNEKGVVFYNYYDGKKYETTIKGISKWINLTLRNKKVTENSKSIKDYSKFIKDFQKAYGEIKS